MIKLTNQLDNIVYVNPDHITCMQICWINEVCDITKVNSPTTEKTWGTGFSIVTYNDLSEHKLGVRIHFVNGHSLIVTECLRDIKKLMKETEGGIISHD